PRSVHDELAAREYQLGVHGGEVGPFARDEAVAREQPVELAPRHRRAEGLLPQREDGALERRGVVEADRAIARRLHDGEHELDAGRLQPVNGDEERGHLRLAEVHEQTFGDEDRWLRPEYAGKRG